MKPKFRKFWPRTRLAPLGSVHEDGFNAEERNAYDKECKEKGQKDFMKNMVVDSPNFVVNTSGVSCYNLDKYKLLLKIAYG